MQELRVVFALWGVLLGASASAQTVGPPPCPQASNTVATAPAAYQPAYPAPQTAPPQYVTAPGGAVYQLVYPAQYGAATGGAVYQPAYAAPQAAPWQYGATPIAPVYPAPSLVPPPSPAPMMGPTDRNVPSYPPSGAGTRRRLVRRHTDRTCNCQPRERPFRPATAKRSPPKNSSFPMSAFA